MKISKNDVDHGEPFINDGFCDRVDWILEDTILHDDTYKYYEKYDKTQEERAHLSELERLLRGFEKSDFAVAVMTALENYPYMVLQCVAEYITRKGN